MDESLAPPRKLQEALVECLRDTSFAGSVQMGGAAWGPLVVGADCLGSGCSFSTRDVGATRWDVAPRVSAMSPAALRKFSLIEFSVCQGKDMVRLNSEGGGD